MNTGSSKEWRREELLRLYLQTSKVLDVVRVCGVFGTERALRPPASGYPTLYEF